MIKKQEEDVRRIFWAAAYIGFWLLLVYFFDGPAREERARQELASIKKEIADTEEKTDRYRAAATSLFDRKEALRKEFEAYDAYYNKPPEPLRDKDGNPVFGLQVVDEDGQPIAGASVEIKSYESYSYKAFQGKTDENGMLYCQMRNGEYSIFIQAKGYLATFEDVKYRRGLVYFRYGKPESICRVTMEKAGKRND